MVFDAYSSTLSWKEEIAKVEAGSLTMFAKYTMTDTFVGKSFFIGLGIS